MSSTAVSNTTSALNYVNDWLVKVWGGVMQQQFIQ